VENPVSILCLSFVPSHLDLAAKRVQVLRGRYAVFPDEGAQPLTMFSQEIPSQIASLRSQ